MPRRRTPEAQVLAELEEELSSELKKLFPQAVKRASQILHDDLSVHSFHGIIGGKNNQFVDAVRTQFSDPDDFLARWFQGLVSKAKADIAAQQQYKGVFSESTAATRLVLLMKDETVRDYTTRFLTRNFYRNLDARTRAKPNDRLWRLWFGDNKLTWGLLIAPAFRNGEWTNDKSEIRRAKYSYWTVGHVIETGIVDPESDKPMMFKNVDDLLVFYRSILKRVSNSLYEKAIADRYAAHLEASKQPLTEPFLIPEIRYAGLDHEHKHRLDFSALNSHVMSYVGFELSPASTHYSIAGTTKKSQKEVNAELAAQWEKEQKKRNAYFQDYGISIITFTDTDLKDMDKCFAVMMKYLSERPPALVRLADQIGAIERLNVSAA